VVHGVEVATAVFVGLAHQPGLDQVENDLPEVIGTFDAPQVKHGAGHQAELAQGELANALQKFAAADVMIGATLLALGAQAVQLERGNFQGTKQNSVASRPYPGLPPAHLRDPDGVPRQGHRLEVEGPFRGRTPIHPTRVRMSSAATTTRRPSSNSTSPLRAKISWASTRPWPL